MTRQIKFKVWDKEHSKWYEPTHEAYKGNLEYLVLGLSGNLSMMKNGQMHHESAFPNRFEKMQFTGLLDKNGKEIYEGDIVEIEEICAKVFECKEKEEVRFVRGGFCFSGASIDHISDINGVLRGVIIGNIYEHPHLLTSEVN